MNRVESLVEEAVTEYMSEYGSVGNDSSFLDFVATALGMVQGAGVADLIQLHRAHITKLEERQRKNPWPPRPKGNRS